MSSALIQDAWLVRATVMHLDEDFSLDILVTHKAWQGDQPPAAGQEIEGRLWLQGALATDA